MKYLDAKFSSRPATDAYRDGWERAFGVFSAQGSRAEPVTLAEAEDWLARARAAVKKKRGKR